MRKKTWISIMACLFLFFGVALLTGFLAASLEIRKVPALSSAEGQEKFRRLDVAAERFAGGEAEKAKEYRQLTEDYLYHGGALQKTDDSCDSVSWFHLLLSESLLKEYQNAFSTLLSDLTYFPVAKDAAGGETVSFGDSWGGARSYGGERRHEGTDIMPSTKERGYFPVVSVSDGIVEKKGWLKLGGYRLGIRAKKGAYFYYAHLDHYADGIEEGTAVKAGQVIGYMGDSGYGEEGTVGKFEVHLHFGIYMNIADKEVSVNPYQILRYLEKRQVVFGVDSTGNGVHTQANL